MRYLFVVLMLAGCATPEQRAREQQQRNYQYSQALQSRCDGYGFKRGEPAFANCLQQLDMAIRQQRAVREAQNDAAANAMAMQYLSGQQQELNRLNRPGITCWRNGDLLQCR